MHLLADIPYSSLRVKAESKEEARFVQNILYRLGLCWRAGQSLKDFIPSIDSKKVYHIHPSTATVTYSEKDWYVISGGCFEELNDGKTFLRLIKEWISEHQEQSQSSPF